MVPPNPRELGNVGFNLELLLGGDAQLKHIVPELVQLHTEEIREFERGGIGVEVGVLAGDGDELFPVPVPQSVRFEVLNERERILETLNRLGNLGKHGRVGELLDLGHVFYSAFEVVGEREELSDVQLREQRLAQLLDGVEVRAVNGVDLLLNFELFRNLIQFRVGCDRQVEEFLGHGELIFHRGLLIELLDELIQRHEPLVQHDVRDTRTLRRKPMLKLLHSLRKLLNLLYGHLCEVNLAVGQGVVHPLALRLQRRPRDPDGERGVEYVLVHVNAVNPPRSESFLDIFVFELHLHIAVAHPRDYLQHALEVIQGVALNVDPGVLVGQIGGYPRHPLGVDSVHLPTYHLDPVCAFLLQ